MTISAPFNKQGDFEVVPSGNHLARVYSIVHIGTIAGEYMGTPQMTDMVRITFELPTVTKEFKEGEGEKPFSVSRDYTNSMSEKANLYALVEGMLGGFSNANENEVFNVLDLMGKSCLLNVIHKTAKASGNQYALIQGASPLPQGMEMPEAVNKEFILDFNDNWSNEKFESLPDFIKDKIKGSNEYKGLKGVPFADDVTVTPEPTPEYPVQDSTNNSDKF